MEPNIARKIETFLAFLSPVLSILALLAAGYMFIKMRTITAALALLVSPRALHANSLPEQRIWMPDAWKKAAALSAANSQTISPIKLHQYTLPYWQEVDFQDDSFRKYITTLLTLILVIMMLVCCSRTGCRLFSCCWKCHRRVESSLPILASKDELQFKIFLAIGNSTQSCLIELTSIPFCPSDYEFRATKFVEKITVSGFFFPKLLISWPDLEISHRYAALLFKLPSSVAINWQQSRLAKQILLSDNYVLLYLQRSKNSFQLVPLADTVWAEQALIPLPLANPSSNENPPLYPNLQEITRL